MITPLYHFDVFTDHPFSGNPAAVCLLDSWLDDGWLRKVAAENNVSATAFLMPSGHGYDLRWFTPVREIKLCGHATLAAGYFVCQILQPRVNIARFSTRFRGIVTVTQKESSFRMDFPAFPPQTCSLPPESLHQALGQEVTWSEILEANDTYIAVLDNEQQIQNLSPNVSLLEQLHPFAVNVTAPGENSDFVSRYFAPSYGVSEDPVTGSAHCALAPYWAQRLNKSRLHARQLSERGGELWCELRGDRVVLEGQAVLTMQGSLEI